MDLSTGIQNIANAGCIPQPLSIRNRRTVKGNVPDIILDGEATLQATVYQPPARAPPVNDNLLAVPSKPAGRKDSVRSSPKRIHPRARASHARGASRSSSPRERARTHLRQPHYGEQDAGEQGCKPDRKHPIQLYLQNEPRLDRNYFLHSCAKERQCQFELTLAVLEDRIPWFPSERAEYEMWLREHSRLPDEYDLPRPI